jgi:undecaprenyl-phosphate 4-deoxy-4-formamido-L-arabinose transferase
MYFSLVVPLWNEEKNIGKLIDAIHKSQLNEMGMNELILVNNGSSDNTGLIIEKYSKIYKWIVTLHLKENLNYGGGVYEGFKLASSEILCYIPGDLQVMPQDVVSVYKSYLAKIKDSPKLLVKGNRVIRYDPFQTRLVSKIYTWLANFILRVNVKDVNGLPKMFTSDLLSLLPEKKMKTFVFDSQLLFEARNNHWCIYEIPVTFHSRREGVSSWSKKRIATYCQIFFQLLQVRKLKKVTGE